jgi:RsiW-degrading membrane proteinase PrsW (M82 family)
MNSFLAHPGFDAKTFITAILWGIVPALLWLFFWLREDKEHKEPRGLIFLTFISGMVSVFFAVGIQKVVALLPYHNTALITLWVVVEECIKLLVILLIVRPTRYIDEPIDYGIYFIIAGLGFAGMENALFLLKPLAVSDATVALLTGQMRFLGSTLLHATASGLIGIMVGLAFYQGRTVKIFSGFIGLALAIGLHTVFNLFIIDNNGETTLQIFGFLWVVTIINILLFEKLRRMSGVE